MSKLIQYANYNFDSPNYCKVDFNNVNNIKVYQGFNFKYFNTFNCNKVLKINKNIVDKIIKLYESDYLENDDSLLIVINEEITENVINIEHTINTIIQESYTLPDEKLQTLLKLDSDVVLTFFNLQKFLKNHFKKEPGLSGF